MRTRAPGLFVVSNAGTVWFEAVALTWNV